MTDLSVCLVSWNTREYLEEALLSVYQNTHEASFEVIVVDNASGDGSPQMVRDHFPKVKLIANEENLFLSAGMNQAIDASEGRYVVLLGSDATVLSGALDVMLKYMDNHQQVGAVGGKIINPGGSVQLTCARAFPTLLTEAIKGTSLDQLFPRNRFFGRYLMSWWGHDEIREVDLLDAACMMVRRRTIENVGLLDEAFPLYSQDLDWCYRIKQAGWEIHYLPVAEVFHYDSRSVRQLNTSGIKWSRVECRRGMLSFFRKHYGFWPFQLLRMLTVLGLAAKLLFWRACSLFSIGARSSLKEEASAYREIMGICLSPAGLASRMPLHVTRSSSIKSSLEERSRQASGSVSAQRHSSCKRNARPG
jgi:GT2 family glycosyltransferase